MSNDIFRILQLAGLKSLNEDVNVPAQGKSDFQKKFVPAKPGLADRKHAAMHNTQSNYWPEEDESMVQEDEFEGEEGGEGPEDMDGLDQDMVTITLPRNCAEWLKSHLEEDMGVDGEEAEAVKDAIDEALCGDEGCEDPNGMYDGEGEGDVAGDEGGDFDAEETEDEAPAGAW